MKRLLSILFLLAALLPARAQWDSMLPLGTNDYIINSTASYGTQEMETAYRASFFYLMFPQVVPHFRDISQSGDNLSSICNSNLPYRGTLPASFGSRVFVHILHSENGGLNATTETVQWLTNIANAPGTTFSAAGFTNFGGYFHTASNTWLWNFCGTVDDGDSINEARNNTVTNWGTTNGYSTVDMFHATHTNGTIVYHGGGHPDADGYKVQADVNLIAIPHFSDYTNVNTAVLDWNDGSMVSTSHCVVISSSKSGNTVTFTKHDDRHSPAYDTPRTNAAGVITNDARNAFVIMPQLTNLFFEGFRIANAPDGNYSISVGGAFDRFATGTELRSGVNFYHDFNNPMGRLRLEVLDRIRNQNGCFTYSPFDEYFALDANGNATEMVEQSNGKQQWFLNAVQGTDYLAVAQLQTVETSLRTNDTYINTAAQPSNTLFAVGLVTPRYAPAHR